MEIRNPIVIRMAMLLEELDEGPLRAAYMVVNELHDLQKNGGGKNDTERTRADSDDKEPRRPGAGTGRRR